MEKMKICAIHQPQFLPWLGYLDKIVAADKFVFLDDVQFKKNEFQNRNRVLVFGQAQWITVPVSFKFGDTLQQVKIADRPGWNAKSWDTLVYNYCKTPFFDKYASDLHDLLFAEWDNLAAVNMATVKWLLRCFFPDEDFSGIVCSSDMSGLNSNPTGRLVEICRQLDADVYLSGAGGRGYLDESVFAENGIRLVFQDYQHPVYPQQSNRAPVEFAPFLSAVDALFNIGAGSEARARLFGFPATGGTVTRAGTTVRQIVPSRHDIPAQAGTSIFA